MPVSDAATPPAPRRARNSIAALGVLACVLIAASTLEIAPLRQHVGLRVLVLLSGLLFAAPVVASLVSGGRVDETNRHRCLLAVVAIHFLATLYVFPPEVFFDRRPIVTVDHAVHYAQCVRTRSVFWHSLRTNAYSPYFMAGYPSGTVFDVDMKGAEFFCTLSPLPTALALKFFVLGAYLTLVFTVFKGARMLGFGSEESLFGLLVFLLYWHWGRPYAGDFRFVGMFSFVFASHLCLLLAGVLRRFLHGSHRRTLFVLSPLTFLIHITALVMALAPLVTVLATERARLRRPVVEKLAMCVLVVLLVNVLWLKPVIEFLPDKTPTRVYYQLHGMRELAGILGRPGNLLALALLALACVGTWRLARDGRGRIALPCAIGALFLLLCAGYGVYVPGLDQTEPGRFLFAALVFTAPLAGVGARRLLDAVLATLPAAGRARFRTATIVALALAPLPLALVEAKTYYRHTVRVDFSPSVASLVAEILECARPGARLMIEDASASAYGGAHLPALLPLWTQVEQIGGPYPHTPLRHYRTSFTSEDILGTPLAKWRPGDLSERLDFLRVRWIVTVTPPTAEVIASLPGVSRRWEEGGFVVWELPERQRDPAVIGDFNRLEVDFRAGGRGAVIPYHWVNGLHASAPAEIVPVLRYDDPVPYIYVRPRGLSRVVISY